MDGRTYSNNNRKASLLNKRREGKRERGGGESEGEKAIKKVREISKEENNRIGSAKFWPLKGVISHY